MGLVTGTCFADLGANVICVDTDRQKVNRLIFGSIPIYEPGLEKAITTNVNEGRLRFVSDFAKGFTDVEYVFCAIDTTPDKDGSTDLAPIYDIARVFGQTINQPCTFVLKSTVPVGTAQRVIEIIQQEVADRKCDLHFDVVSNPDFITEGKVTGPIYKKLRGK